jgi:hypothetical protein
MTQDEARALLKTGGSVFLTGEPGSGKTHTVNRYIELMRRQGVGVAFTASTGIAATHRHSITIHAWSGTGVRCPDPPRSRHYRHQSASRSGSRRRAFLSSTRSPCCRRAPSLWSTGV